MAIPSYLPSKLCEWLNINVTDVYAKDGRLITLRLNAEAVTILLTSLIELIDKTENKADYVNVGWIAHKMKQQLDAQLKVPTPATEWSLDALKAYRDRILDLSDQEKKDLDYLIDELQKDVDIFNKVKSNV